jgi:hypothetical protein
MLVGSLVIVVDTITISLVELFNALITNPCYFLFNVDELVFCVCACFVC